MMMYNNNVEEYHKNIYSQGRKGTTTVGILCKDGVILAADKKATAFYTENRYENKVFPINSKVAITTAGSVGDLQYIHRVLKAEASLHEIRSEVMSTGAAATLISNILNGSKYYPYMVSLLVGGYNEDNTPAIYSIDPVGGATTGEKIVTTGSGGPIALGVLESHFKEGIGISEGKVLAIKALLAAIERDVYTGGRGLDLVVITPKGVSRVPKDEVEKIIETEKASMA